METSQTHQYTCRTVLVPPIIHNGGNICPKIKEVLVLEIG
jgi:hypothetical protein